MCLQVKESTLIDALTKKKTTAGGETVVINYKLADVSTHNYKMIIDRKYICLIRDKIYFSCGFSLWQSLSYE